MKTFAGIVAVLVALLILAAIVWLIFGSVAYVAASWSSLDKSVATLAMASFLALLLGAWIIARGPVRAATLKIQENSRRHCSDIYLRLLEAWTTDLDRNDEATWEQSLWRAEQELALCGSSQVIAKYALFRRQATSKSDEIGPALAELMAAMRKSLGQATLQNSAELASLVLPQSNDLDEAAKDPISA